LIIGAKNNSNSYAAFERPIGIAAYHEAISARLFEWFSTV
jgi:hypothetical protein